MSDIKIIVISDVDGCLTDGGMYYDSTGKVMKKFSAGDHEGLKWLLKNGIDVEFITADKAGLPIVQKRIQDMSNAPLHFVTEKERVSFIESYSERYEVIIFFGDGPGDAMVKRKMACNWFICPAQSVESVKDEANYVLTKRGGDGAFLELAELMLDELKRYDLIENIKELYE